MAINTFVNNKYAYGITSELNGKAVISGPNLTANLSDFVSKITGFDFTEFLGFNNFQDVAHSITYYPINLAKPINGISPNEGVLCIKYDPIGSAVSGYAVAYPFRNELYETGFHVSEFYIDNPNSFKDLEPYCSTDVWLPFCGRINLPRAKIVGKYINIFLFIDFNTGNAQYIVATSVNSILANQHQYYPTLKDWDFSLDEIIATEDFVLGYKMPIGTLGFNDYLRNTVVGVAKTASAIYGASVMTPSHLIPTEKVTVKKTRNKKTGRLITTYKKSETAGPANESDVKDYRKGRVALATSASLSSLGLNQMQASISNTNNPIMMYGTSDKVYLINTRSKIIPYTEEFDKLYGRPLGETRKLEDVHGYTDIATIRLEGEGFNTATEEEMDMIESIMLSGVILP